MRAHGPCCYVSWNNIVQRAHVIKYLTKAKSYADMQVNKGIYTTIGPDDQDTSPNKKFVYTFWTFKLKGRK